LKPTKKTFIKPDVVSPGEVVTEFCRLLDSPLLVKGITWLLQTQVLVWGLLSVVVGQRKPERA